MVGWLGFGLNAATTRDVALSNDYHLAIKNTQSSRISLSIIFFFVGIIGVIFSTSNLYLYIALILAPIYALNYDFVLYGLGRPVNAAALSFVRLSAPLAVFIVFVLAGKSTTQLYVLLVVAANLLVAVLVARNIGTPLFYKPELKFHKAYIISSGIGVAGLLLGFQRYGFINFLEEYLTNDEVVKLLITVKVFIFAVGCKRLLIQFFYKKIIEEKFSARLNYFCMVMIFLGMLACWLFPHVFSYILFNDYSYGNFVKVIFLGIASILFFATSDAQLLLMRKDKWMIGSTIITALTFILIVYFLRSSITIFEVLILMVMSEFTLSLLYWVGVKVNFKKSIKENVA